MPGQIGTVLQHTESPSDNRSVYSTICYIFEEAGVLYIVEYEMCGIVSTLVCCSPAPQRLLCCCCAVTRRPEMAAGVLARASTAFSRYENGHTYSLPFAKSDTACSTVLRRLPRARMKPISAVDVQAVQKLWRSDGGGIF